MLSKTSYAINKRYESLNGEPWERAWHSSCIRAKQFKLPKGPFKARMESLFKNGMTWENYGEWEVDHIVPLSKGGKHSPQNLQPLWRLENKIKGSKLGA